MGVPCPHRSDPPPHAPRPGGAASRPRRPLVLLVRHGDDAHHRQDAAGPGRRAPPLGEGPGPGGGGGRAHRRADEGAHRRLRLAARADPRDGCAHRPGTRPARAHRPRAHRGRRRRVDREAAGAACTRPRSGPRCSAGRAASASPAASPSPRCPSAAMDAVLGLVAEHPGETIVAVSHADTIKAIVAASAGMPLDLMQRLVVSPCSISAILFTAGGPVVLCVNSTGTLDELVRVVDGAPMSDEFDFDAPDHCTVGVIGEVGNRLFLFYCRQGLTETTVKVEKQQMAVLAGYLGTHRQGARPSRAPARGPRVLRHRGVRVGGGHHRRLLRRGARPHHRGARGGRASTTRTTRTRHGRERARAARGA